MPRAQRYNYLRAAGNIRTGLLAATAAYKVMPRVPKLLFYSGGRPVYASGRKRKGQEHPGSFKRNVRSKKKSKRVKIGSYAGKLIASKPVTVPKAGARIRQRKYGMVESADKVWVFGNNLGCEQYFCSLAGEAIISHLLRECKDYRADKGQPGSLEQYTVSFRSADALFGTGASREFIMNLAADSSFDGMVYNTLGGSGNTSIMDGVALGAGVGNLPQILFEQAIEGFYPTGLAAGRATDSFVYRDTQFAKAMISIKVGCIHKFQNVTAASGGNDNVNAVDANPLMGKIATFRNLSPTWNKGWLSANPGGQNVLTNFSARASSITNWEYPMTSIFNVPADSLDELRAMPLRMPTVFANSKTSTKVHFPPGGYKTFRTGFSFKGSIFKFMRDTTQVSSEPSGDKVGKYPSLGDSFGMCLVPTIKQSADSAENALKIQFDYDRDGSAHIVKYRGGYMPTTNMIQ